VAASIAQLVVMYSRSEDPFFSWTFTLLVTIIQTLGIVTACGPYLKPFLDSINSGMIGNDDIRRRHGGTVQGSYPKHPKGSKQSKESKNSGRGLFLGRSKRESRLDEESELEVVSQQIPGQGHKVQVSSAAKGGNEEWETGSQSSRAKIIRHTTYRVSSETN
jgi:hypothetical protein